MALKTAGTNATNTLKAIQWQPAGMNQTDLAAFLALIRSSVTGAYGAAATYAQGFIENGRLFLPDGCTPQGIQLTAGDWLMVDGAGNVIVVPASTFATSWTHS